MPQLQSFPKSVFILASLAFCLVGCVTIALVVIGYYELEPSSSYLGIEGMAEVLLIVGIYFFIPYVFILLCGLVVYYGIGITATEAESTRQWLRAMQIMLLAAYFSQQVFTDLYILEWRGVGFLLIFILFDIVIPLVYINTLLHDSTVPAYLYTTMYAVKLAVMWDIVPLMSPTDPRWAYGPNGMRVMLFLCIPIVQLPMYISLVEKGSNVMQAFTKQMNAVLGHLLHSLDIFTVYEIAFTKGISSPTSVLSLCCVFMTLAFLANNICFASLFHQQQKIDDRKQQTLESPVRSQDSPSSEVAYAAMPDEKAVPIPGSTALERTQQEDRDIRVLTFMLLLTFFVDLPFLILRFTMWYMDGVQLSLFIVKDLKNIIEVAMMVSRNQLFTRAALEKFRWWD